MIDHLGLSVSDYGRSKAFYLAALKPLGYELIMEVTEAGPYAGFGEGGKPDFWIGRGKASTAHARRLSSQGPGNRAGVL